MEITPREKWTQVVKKNIRAGRSHLNTLNNRLARHESYYTNDDHTEHLVISASVAANVLMLEQLNEHAFLRDALNGAKDELVNLNQQMTSLQHPATQSFYVAKCRETANLIKHIKSGEGDMQ